MTPRPLLAVLLLLVALPAAVAGPLAPSPHTVVCYRDTDTLNGRSPGDAIVLQVGPCGAGGSNVGDLRFTATAGYAAGTLVRGVDSDYSRATAPTNMAGYGFVDRDGTQRFSPGDEILLHFGPLPGPVAIGDIDITGADAFTVVTGSSPWMNNQLLAGPAVGDEMYSEVDGQPGFSVGDALM
ncbi:MAG TPA: hypothetical protein VI796_02945, partial [Candidatus Thermoplasmatota archaeon]|nr:hypothetical protein [Candidatus Thermoplasmatota archaeon]